MEFVPICARRYQEVLVNVTGKEPAAAILDAIPAGSGQDIYRFRLTGERKGHRAGSAGAERTGGEEVL